MDDHDVGYGTHAGRLTWRGLEARQVASQQLGGGRAHQVDGDVPRAVLPAQPTRVHGLLLQGPHVTSVL